MDRQNYGPIHTGIFPIEKQVFKKICIFWIGIRSNKFIIEVFTPTNYKLKMKQPHKNFEATKLGIAAITTSLPPIKLIIIKAATNI